MKKMEKKNTKGFILNPYYVNADLIKPPYVVSEGVLIRPSFDYIFNMIKPIGKDDQGQPFKLTEQLLKSLGFEFEYDEKMKAERASCPYLSLWFDSNEQDYFTISKHRTHIMVRTFEKFQEAFCYCFCNYFKPYSDFMLLEYVVKMDKVTLKKLL